MGLRRQEREKRFAQRLANHKMAADVTAGYIVSAVERLREPMNKIHEFIAEKVGEEILNSPKARKNAKVLKVDSKKRAQ